MGKRLPEKVATGHRRASIAFVDGLNWSAKGSRHVKTVEIGALKGREFSTWWAPHLHIRICNFAFSPSAKNQICISAGRYVIMLSATVPVPQI
jgi:hypothetical protein